MVNSEFYPGWLDYWGHPHNTVDVNQSANTLDRILATGANVNVYMAHGGTSFGFGNGANTGPFSIGELYESFDRKRAHVKYQFQSKVIKAML